MAQPLEPLPLFLEETPQPPRAEPGADAVRPSSLWIAMHLREPAAGPADEGRLELESLAERAYAVTPAVSLEPPDALLLEVGGSLKLFGGLGPIKDELAKTAHAVTRRREACHASAAPTPLGALWLARAGHADALDLESLRAGLSRLPLEATTWPEEVRALLSEMGLRRIGDCLRLPRDGFARRAGPARLCDLDRALGRRSDPRAAFERPAELHWSLELPLETRELASCGRAIDALLDELVAALRRCQYQAQTLEIVLYHKDRPATVRQLELVHAVHEKQRFLEPLLAGLERVALPAPVVAVSLRAGDVQPMQIQEAALFAESGGGAERASRVMLLERLRERLGPECVHGLELVADHRPERAWAASRVRRGETAPRSPGVSPWAHHRPLWLLSAPLPLREGLMRFGHPRIARLESGPERIESGWWDGGGIRRDYYTVVAEHGERLWVYRDLVTREWYMQGLFG